MEKGKISYEIRTHFSYPYRYTFFSKSVHVAEREGGVKGGRGVEGRREVWQEGGREVWRKRCVGKEGGMAGRREGGRREWRKRCGGKKGGVEWRREGSVKKGREPLPSVTVPTVCTVRIYRWVAGTGGVWKQSQIGILCKAVHIFMKKLYNWKSHMTPKVLAYHLEGPRVPLLVRVPQVGNHCTNG